MVDEEKIEPEPQAEAGLDDMTSEQLADLIDGREAEPEEVVEEPEAVEEVTEEPEEAPEEEQGEPDPEPPPVEARLQELQERLEQAELKRQAEEERRRHVEFMLSRRAGEAGNLRQRLRELEATPPAVQSADDPYAEQVQRPTAPVQPGIGDEIRSELEEMRNQRFLDAARNEWNSMQERNKEFWQKIDTLPETEKSGFGEAFQTKLKAEMANYEHDILDAQARGDAKLASSIIRASYGAALFDARSEHAEKLRATQTKDQSASLKERKLAASAGASGTRPRPRRRTKTLDDMTPDELAAEIDRRAREGIYL